LVKDEDIVEEGGKKALAFAYRNLWLLPATTVMVSCVGKAGVPNIITIAACGVASSNPPLISLAIGVGQYSLKLIKETKDFVVNVPSQEQVYVTDWCGSVSGLDVNKFAKVTLTPGRSLKVKSPYIVECPVNYECTLWKTINCGNHELVLGEIQQVHVNRSVLKASGEEIDPKKFNPLVSFQMEYWNLGKRMAKWHFSQRHEG